MTRRFWCFAAVVLHSLILLAQPASHRNFTRDGVELPSALPSSGSTVDVIVQFRDEPLFARGRGRLSTNAIQDFEQRFATFERDLAGLDHGVATNSAPAEIRARYSRTFAGAAITVTRETLQRVAKLDYVRAIHVDRPVQAFLEHSVPKIRAPEVWATFGTRGSGVVVAVIDTGIDYNHPALGSGFGPGHRVIGGWDFVNDDSNPLDDAGHGTHVAGIIGGNGGGITGVAPEVTFLAYKVLDQHGNGSDSSVLSGIERAADPNNDGNPSDHADVANVSLGGLGSPTSPVSLAVETATQAGVLFCIATGNSGSYNTISSPGNAPSALSVGATTLDDHIAVFSSKGPVGGTFAIKPEVVAPGVGIVSAKMGGGTLAANGTSMATPHVAGVAALLRAVHPAWSAAEVKGAIVGTAEALDADVMAQGAGRVDALRAASADVIASPSTLSFGRDDVTQAEWSISRTFNLTNRGTATRTLTLDAPSPHAGVTVALSVSTVTLAADESKPVTFTIHVHNAQVPSPQSGSLAYAGVITVNGAAMPLRLPWAFIKAAIITITYDRNDEFEAFVASTSATSLIHAIGDSEARTATVAVPAGEYDIKFTPFDSDPNDYRPRTIVVEKQNVENALTIPIRRDMAAHEIVSDAKDEFGVPLADAARNGICQQSLVMLWPQQSAIGMSAIAKGGPGGILVSTLSDRFTILPFQRCVDYGRKVAYSAQLEPLHGVSAPVTRTLAASEWTRNPLRVAIPAGAEEPSVTLSAGWMWHGAYWSFSDYVAGDFRASGDEWTGTAYVTRDLHPTVKAMMTVSLDVKAPPGAFSPFGRFTAIESLPVRASGDGTWLWRYLTKAPTTYVAAPNEELTFGEGLIHPQTSNWVENGYLLAGTGFIGSLDEDRSGEALDTMLTLRGESGAVVSSGQVFLPPAQIAPGAYRFEATKENGSLQLVSTFDTRRTDGAPPSLTTLRLLDGNGRVASRLGSREAGTLLFSAIDRVPDELGGAKRGAIAAESMQLRWKNHGAAAWNTLPITVVAEEIANGAAEVDALGHVPMGTVFRADLLPITSSTAGQIDLSLRFEDAAGNAYEYTISPAFAVTYGSRRRPARH